MSLFTEKALGEILSYLEKSIINLSKEAFENLEFEDGIQGAENFLKNQFDIRLENLLVAKGSSIHHLESRMKNKIIQRKQKIFDEVDKKDECLVPIDYAQSYFIKDDDINAHLVDQIKGTKFFGVIDACHSGTIFDLRHSITCVSEYEGSNDNIYDFNHWTSAFTLRKNNKY